MGTKFARGVVLAAVVAGMGAAGAGAAQAAPAYVPTYGPNIVCANTQPGIAIGDTGTPCTMANGKPGRIHIW